MTDNEMLLALSDMLDKKLDAKLKPLENDIRNIRLDMENIIKPQLNLLTENIIIYTHDRKQKV